MNKILFLIIWGMLAMAFLAGAQEAPRAVDGAPGPPFVNKAPLPSHWEIQYSYPVPPGGEARFLKKVIVTKAGDKKREVFEWSDGAQSETWHVAGYVLYQQPHFEPGDVAILGAEKHLDPGDFRALSWIGKDSYRAQERRGGRLCHFYEGNPAAGSSGRFVAVPSTPPSIFRAWIDAETRLPVAVERTWLIEEYFFKPEGAPTLNLPPLFARKLEEFLARKKLIKPLLPPF